jgi:hypothetical protein
MQKGYRCFLFFVVGLLARCRQPTNAEQRLFRLFFHFGNSSACMVVDRVGRMQQK